MKKQDATERIKEMEEILDRVSEVLSRVEKDLDEFEKIQSDIQKLESYYTGLDWKKDFRLDEEGKLPKDLKRGVLSEDGIYNLLEKNKELMELIKKEDEA